MHDWRGAIERLDWTEWRIRVVEVGVIALNSGIEDGPEDAPSLSGKSPLGRIGLDRDEGSRQSDADVAVFPDAIDDRVLPAAFTR